MKLSEAITKYTAFGQFKNKPSSMSTYYTHLRLMAVYFRNCELEEVKLGEVVEYIQIMKDCGWDSNSFTGKCSAYKQFFKFFKGQGYQVVDPEMIPIPRAEYKFPKIIETPDINKLLEALDKHPGNIHRLKNQTLIRILRDTGVRLGELRSMKVQDMDTEGMKTVIKTEKSRGGIKPIRAIFWTKDTNIYLKDYVRARAEFLKNKGYEDKGQWLWISAHGTWNVGNQWSAVAIEAMLKRLSLEAKLGYTANPHVFRHHFGKTLAINGANQSVIADMMGHASIENTRIYTVLNETMMQNTHKKYFKG